MQVKDPFSLDWGSISPEGYSEQKKEVIFIFNFDLSSQENVERCIVFSVGKILWAMKNIPSSKYKIVLDVRGQALALLNRAGKMKEDIINTIVKAASSLLGLEVEILI